MGRPAARLILRFASVILSPMDDVTQILSQIEQGDPAAAEQLLPLVYDELRKLASAKMAQEKPGQTLQSTGLVHEAYLRLVNVKEAQKWNSRGHFFSAAAEAMRRILIERARSKQREKHGGDLRRVPLDELSIGVDSPPDVLIHFDECLRELAEKDPQTAELIKLHCFAGLAIEQAADLLGIATRTAYRDWAYARAWLFQRIESRDSSAEY
jgi:RNA polymerase sigma factor (TIGR02999 family)